VKCIVTAGPTYEPVDEVRRLTNFSTGRLGVLLANHLAGLGHDTTLLLGHYATVRAAVPKVRVREFTTTQNLADQLRELGSDACAAIFHAAAVSDFSVSKIWRRQADGTLAEVNARKIPTQDGALLAELSPTPKIIARLRAWHPASLLVGWKYELDGGRPEVIAKGLKQIQTCATNACVVNGRAYGPGFGIVSGDGQCAHCDDPASLCAALSFWLPAQ
jgi:phosphopantothenate---cysteine ligase (CTP)